VREEREPSYLAVKNPDIGVRAPRIPYNAIKDSQCDGNPDPDFDFSGRMHPYRNNEADETDQMLQKKDLVA
jgi:hypothetical protein